MKTTSALVVCAMVPPRLLYFCGKSVCGPITAQYCRVWTNEDTVFTWGKRVAISTKETGPTPTPKLRPCTSRHGTAVRDNCQWWMENTEALPWVPKSGSD